MKNHSHTALANLEIALQHHRAGRLQQAEEIYKKMPNNPDALHLRGVIAHQLNRYDEAVELINKAIRIAPANAAYYFSIELAYRALNRLDDIVTCYQALLKLVPNNAVAHSNLGNALKAQGRFDDAVTCYQTALTLDPGYAIAHSNLGSALAATGHLDDAVAHYQTALTLKPDFVEGYYNLAGVLKAQGKSDDAITHYRKALALRPDFADAYVNLGSTLAAQNKLDEAIDCYRQALTLRPNFAEAYGNLGNALKEQKKLENAIDCYQRALMLKPDFSEAHNNLGNALKEQNKLDDAIECYRKAIAFKPDFIQAYGHLGNALKEQDKLDEAVTCFQQAHALKSDDTSALINLGNGYRAQEKFGEAMMCYLDAIALKPDFAEAYNNLGLTLKDKGGNTGDAIACYQTAITLKPDLAEAHNNLGDEFLLQGSVNEAIASFHAALSLKPDFPGAHSNLGFAFHTQGKTEEALACYREALKYEPDFALAHHNLLLTMLYASNDTPEEIFAEHVRFATQFETSLKSHWMPHANPHDPNKRLRIGYVSPDFRKHAVAYSIEPVLACHDKSAVEVFCYYNHTHYDPVTLRIKQLADHWIPCKQMSDEQLAERIRADGIDILIDLAGHTGGNRLLTFARKPAPVQVTYLGYPATTGLTAIDYRLTDAHAEPPGMTEALNVEQLWRLPDMYCCYHAHDKSPAVIDHPPAQDNGYVTFGCFNNFSKVTDPVLFLWARIMQQAPTARLLLEIAGLQDASFRAEVEQRLQRLGLPLERVLLEPRKPENQYVLYNQIDIALDPFPCNGGTTSLDTLWMGVPFITLAGRHFISRMGVTILTNAGLPQLIAQSEDEYVAIAVALAGNMERLAQMRAGLRERVQASPLMDAAHLTMNLEQAYRGMWQAWCAGDDACLH